MNHPVNPVLAEVLRGEMVESFHRGAAVVCDAAGTIVDEAGDITRPIYPRSAIKPLQAMTLVQCGAVEHFGLSNREIALACASHSGEQKHVDAIRKWLGKIDVSESSFECGSQPSSHRTTRIDMIRNGLTPGAIYNNCSGKHAGFMTIAKLKGEPIEGYTDRSHPVQQRVLATVEELTGEAISTQIGGLDGCGIPVVGISLLAIARAFAFMVSGNFKLSSQAMAAQRIIAAMTQFPDLVGGENRFCTVVPNITRGQILIKVGAEGVYAGMTTGTRRLGFALKIDDGSRRAAEVAIGAVIRKHCNLAPQDLVQLQPWLVPNVKTVAGKQAGNIRPPFNST